MLENKSTTKLSEISKFDQKNSQALNNFSDVLKSMIVGSLSGCLAESITLPF